MATTASHLPPPKHLRPIATRKPSVEVNHPGSPRYIRASPYTAPGHLLDLHTLDAQSALLARALAVLDKTRDDYATAPYAASFSWPAVIDALRQLVSAQAADQTTADSLSNQLSNQPSAPSSSRPAQPSASLRGRTAWQRRRFFVVAFRSQIPPSTRYADLTSLDAAAHREATASGGLLQYWFHRPDDNGRNLATCVWRSPEDARRAGALPEHRRAGTAARSLYREWRIERYQLDIADNVSSWNITEWQD